MAPLAAAAAAMLPPSDVRATVRAWLKEDAPSFDFGGGVVGERRVRAALIMKSPGVVAGRPFFDAVFHELDCTVTWLSDEDAEGRYFACGSGDDNGTALELALVEGTARRVLLGERVALNALSRCSGVATRAHEFVRVKRAHNWHGDIAGTRKTTPGFRLVEKYGMLLGGADVHRVDLSSMVMLKDNHIAQVANEMGKARGDAAAVVPAAIARARALAGFAVKVEVECGSEAAARAAVDGGAEVVMLDNFEPVEFRRVATLLRDEEEAAEEAVVNGERRQQQRQQRRRRRRSFLIEASGGITLENAPEYFCPAADIVSTSLAQGYACVDYSLKVQMLG